MKRPFATLLILRVGRTTRKSSATSFSSHPRSCEAIERRSRFAYNFTGCEDVVLSLVTMMLRFRPGLLTPSAPIAQSDVRSLISDALRPAHFFVADPLRLAWSYREQDEVSWELYRGRALDHTQTRRREVFESWTITGTNANETWDEPLLAVRYDSRGGQVHVTRSIRCHAWECYSEGGNVLSRPTVRRVRELVGTIDLRGMAGVDDLRDELICLIFQAVVGTSRLPITSLESPLPEFSLGLLAYCYRESAGKLPIDSPSHWVNRCSSGSLNERERYGLLETAIRCTSALDITAVAGQIARVTCRGDGAAVMELVRGMFNGAALTPYTDFVPKALFLLRSLVQQGHLTTADEIDILAHLLRQLGRHLSAFDLIRFHHRGANYPDALLLSELVRRALDIACDAPEHFLTVSNEPQPLSSRKRLRRRALRQAWLLCRQYCGHTVPDAPTSPGENARVLPPPYLRIQDEQILDPAKRTRQLFADGDPFDRGTGVLQTILQQSVADLAESVEARELGIGLFLDRPLGFAKAAGEPDRTTLLSHLAFSATLASGRLRTLRALTSAVSPLGQVLPRGIRWQGQWTRRPGVVSVEDARIAADDFAFLATTRRSVADLSAHYDFEPGRRAGLMDLLASGSCLILPSPELPGRLLIYDRAAELRAELRMESAKGYDARAGIDLLAGGMTLIRAWNGRELADIDEDSVQISPKCQS